MTMILFGIGNQNVLVDDTSLSSETKYLSEAEALENRKKNRESKYNHPFNINAKYHWYSKTIFDRMPLNGEIAFFYKEHYKNCALNTKPATASNNSTNTLRTINNNYLNSKIISFISQAFSAFSEMHSRQPDNDEEMIEFLRTHIPTTAFDIIELDLWKRMYLYANKQGTYTAVKRLDRRTKHTENTYLDFAKWILTNYADYSSNDRYFITGFLADCKNNGLVVSRTKIDDMLRYDLTRDCFSEGDFMALGLCTQAEQDEFFETMDIIKQAQKK